MTTPRDPLAAALREALDAERPTAPRESDDQALIARAIARATATLAVLPAVNDVAATDAWSTGSTSKVASSRVAPSSGDASALAPTAARPASARPSVRRLEIAARPRTRILRVALPLAAAFAASIAMAAVYVSARSPEAPPAPAQPIERPEAPPAPPTTGARVEAPTNVPAETPSISVRDLPSAKPLAAVTPEPVSFPSLPADGPVTAAELFRDANAERRAGEVDKAIDLYRTLQRRFPDASETHASRVSLGRLLLDRKGDAGGALAQFDAYLAGAPATGALAEEARVGRAHAFERLGRSEDEKRAWEELVAKHPQSLYTSRARERLGALTPR